jgi:hypothetical protein
MTIENELHTMYSGEQEALKVNLEDLKRYREGQKVKHDKRFKRKSHARIVAKGKGFRLGRWTGTYSRVKSGEHEDFLFNMNTLELCDSRPGKGSAKQSHEKPVT